MYTTQTGSYPNYHLYVPLFTYSVSHVPHNTLKPKGINELLSDHPSDDILVVTQVPTSNFEKYVPIYNLITGTMQIRLQSEKFIEELIFQQI